MKISMSLGKWGVLQIDLTEVEGVIWGIVLTLLALLTGFTIL